MNKGKKITFDVLCVAVITLTTCAIGFGQFKFYTVDNPIPGKYIVVLNKYNYNEKNSSLVGPTSQSLANQYGGQVGFVYDSSLYGFSVDMSEEDAIALSDNPEVEYVIQDSEMSMNDTQINAPWNLDRVDQRDQPLSSTYNYNYAGSGITAYIIDSGITPLHIEFGPLGSSRAIVGPDFVGGNGADCNGHGTHVAGIIGGQTYGVAKGVFLVGVRVFGCSGNAPTSTIIAGVNWVAANHAAKSVANMSLGGSPNLALDDAVRSLISRGVPTVVAAGNDGADANNFSPSRVREAITVGATDINDTRASFSNFGTAVDVFAPGVNVVSAWPTGTNTLSGTSMATPHVTGVVAQILQSYALSPSPSPSKIQELIVANASWGRIPTPGVGSPNDILYNGSFDYGDPIVPLYRYWSSSGTDHYYTSSWANLGAGANSYTNEGYMGHVSSVQGPDQVPLYQYWGDFGKDHYYTINFSELGTGASGWVYEGITGYVYANPGTGRIPLYRYYNAAHADHLYTTNFSELGYGALGYNYEGIAAYIIP